MATDITEAVLSRLKTFTVALVSRKKGAQNRDVLGSGVLVSIEGRRGILTCGHVSRLYEKQNNVGLTFISSENEYKFELRYDLNLILASSNSFEESEKVLDLAFTLLTPELATAIEATKGVFLNLDRNREKMEAFASSRGQFVDAIFGLIDEFTGEPSTDGKLIVSNLCGSFFAGRIFPRENGLQHFAPLDEVEKLPKSFGGMSGGGVWRVYYDDKKEGDDALSTMMLCGIASWERTDEMRIACQGWDRIDQALVPAVREALPL